MGISGVDVLGKTGTCGGKTGIIILYFESVDRVLFGVDSGWMG